MDRLARNLDDLRRIVQTLTSRGVRIEFVKEHLAFTGEDSESVQKVEVWPREKRKESNQPSKRHTGAAKWASTHLKGRSYPSDVTDEEWAILEPLIPAAKPGGRPQEIERREIVNAILYVLRSACAWRMMPHDLPNWSTAYLYFRQWKQAGVWEQVNAALRRNLRVSLGREPEPSAAILDSQSIKTSSVRGDERGYDGGKKCHAPRGTIRDERGYTEEERAWQRTTI